VDMVFCSLLSYFQLVYHSLKRADITVLYEIMVKRDTIWCEGLYKFYVLLQRTAFACKLKRLKRDKAVSYDLSWSDRLF
jgi:hypothetical protein